MSNDEDSTILPFRKFHDRNKVSDVILQKSFIHDFATFYYVLNKIQGAISAAYCYIN